MNRQNSPLFLKVSIGLGLATAAITSTVRADPGLLTGLHDDVSNQASATPGAVATVRDPRAVQTGTGAEQAQISREALRQALAGLPHQSGGRIATPASSTHPATKHATPTTKKSGTASSGPGGTADSGSASATTPVTISVDDSTPTYTATAQYVEADSTPLYQETTESASIPSPSPHTEHSGQQSQQTNKQHQGDGAHRDGWRVAGNDSTHHSNGGGQQTGNAPRHRAA